MGADRHARVRSLCLAALMLVVPPIQATAETLADALSAAYRQSGLLEQNRALLRAADEQVAVAISATRPILNWAISHNLNATRTKSRDSSLSASIDKTASMTASVNLSLLLYDFGKTRMGIDAEKETVLATRQALVSLEQRVLLSAVRAFMNVRSAAENVGLRENNVGLITQELRAARDRFEVGEVTRTDVSLAEARLAAARSELAAAQGTLIQRQQEYIVAVGHRPGNLVPPGRLPQTAASPAEARATALRIHPDMLQRQHEAKKADIDVLVAKAAMKPSINLSGSAGTRGTFGQGTVSEFAEMSVTASGPLYAGGRLSALLRSAHATRDAVRAQLHITKLAIEQDVGISFAELQVARASREASDRQIRAARVAFRGVREEAKLGSRTTLDVLDAEQELLNAEADKISAIADETIAAYKLLAAMGLLSVDHLGLNVERYDPAEYYNLVQAAPGHLSPQGRKLDRVLKSLQKE